MSEKAFKLRALKLKRVSLVSDPAQEPASVVLFKSDLGSESRDDLDDAKFAAVWTDAEGKKQRKLPIHDASHVRNALARFNQTDMPASVKAKARAKLEAAARRLGVDVGKARKDDGDMDDISCSKCGYGSMKAATKFCPNCGNQMPAGATKMKIDLDKIEDPEVRKQVETLSADLEAAQALAEEEQAKRIKAEQKAPAKDGEDLLKGVPPAIVERLKKAEATAAEANEAVKKMADERREKEFVAKAKGYGNLSVDPAAFGALLKRVADGTSTEKDVEEIHRVLTGAHNALKALFKQKGSENKGDSEQGDALSIVTAKAKELRETVMKSGDKLSMPDAMDRILKENPDLYRQYLAEMGSRVAAVSGSSAGDEE